MAWAKKGFLGCVRNIDGISSLQHRMMEEGIVTVKIISLGGEKVFLKVDEDEDFNDLVKDSNHLFNKWFSILRRWETRDVAGARYIWCRMYEIPVHAWRKRVFSTLISSIGSLIKIDSRTENMCRLDVARVLVRTPVLEFINRSKNILINEERYNIRITKELCDCEARSRVVDNWEIPKFILETDSINSDDTFIPPSFTSLEDEGTRQKLEENFRKLIREEERPNLQNCAMLEAEKTIINEGEKSAGSKEKSLIEN